MGKGWVRQKYSTSPLQRLSDRPVSPSSKLKVAPVHAPREVLLTRTPDSSNQELHSSDEGWNQTPKPQPQPAPCPTLERRRQRRQRSTRRSHTNTKEVKNTVNFALIFSVKKLVNF